MCPAIPHLPGSSQLCPPRCLGPQGAPAIPCLPGSSQLCPTRCFGPQGAPATPTCQDLPNFAPQGASDLSVPSHPPPARIFRTLPSKVLRTSVCPSYPGLPGSSIFAPQGASNLRVPQLSPACQDLHIFAPKVLQTSRCPNHPPPARIFHLHPRPSPEAARGSPPAPLAGRSARELTPRKRDLQPVMDGSRCQTTPAPRSLRWEGPSCAFCSPLRVACGGGCPGAPCRRPASPNPGHTAPRVSSLLQRSPLRSKPCPRLCFWGSPK